MTSTFKTGLFQTLNRPAKDEVIIDDEIYGKHVISEPVLVELLQSPAVARLAGVHQHGISGLLGLTPKMTRLEHCIGAFLLVRIVGGDLDEQVAALLHDISHTTMSHVVDFALSAPGESYHEKHKARYVRTTEIPAILARHGFGDLKPLDEELYPLVEQPSPHLCADRLDYALRDVVGLGHVGLEDARRLVASALRALPSATSPHRLLVLQDQRLALLLARGYMACDRDVWGNPAHGDLYTRTAELMKSLIQGGGVREEELWTLSDEEFWAKMRQAADAQGREAMDRLESEGLPDEAGLPLPANAKVRTIDPDIYTASSGGEAQPLSVLVPDYATEREQYVLARRALYSL